MKRIIDYKQIDSHTSRTLYSLSTPNNHTQTLKNVVFQEITHKKYLRIKVLLSKNQKSKFYRYGTFPKMPKTPIVLSNIMKPLVMGENKKYKNEGYLKFKVGKQVFIVKMLKDIDKLSTKGYKVLVNIMLKYFFQ